MYSRDEAIDMCKRKLYRSSSGPYSNYECYYYDMRCELGYDCENNTNCPSFIEDTFYSNIIHHKILTDYKWCENHIDLMCEVDKKLFLSIYSKCKMNVFDGRKI